MTKKIIGTLLMIAGLIFIGIGITSIKKTQPKIVNADRTSIYDDDKRMQQQDQRKSGTKYLLIGAVLCLVGAVMSPPSILKK